MVNGEERVDNFELKEIVKDFLDKSLLLLYMHLIISHDLMMLGNERPKLGMTNKYMVKKIGFF